MNFGTTAVNLKISLDGLEPNSLQLSGSTKTVLTSANVMDENSFSQPKKVPQASLFPNFSFIIELICSSPCFLIHPSEYYLVYYKNVLTSCMNDSVIRKPFHN